MPGDCQTLDITDLCSISMQTGKPYMIPSYDFIESFETWVLHPLATVENDHFLGALVSLRLEMSTAFTLMMPRRGRQESDRDVASLLSILSRQIESWERTWRHKIDHGGPQAEESCHNFLIQFYGSHLRLQIASLQLQDALFSARAYSKNLESLWLAHSSALRMLHLVTQYSQHLVFAQDSIHVMLVYCAVFLVKV